jgi:hypothetical protein
MLQPRRVRCQSNNALMLTRRSLATAGVAANTLSLFRNGASLLAKAFGVGFIDWLGLLGRFHPDLA